MATDKHYIEYDPDEIWKEIFFAYVNSGGDILYPGDEKEIVLRAMQAGIVFGLARADNGMLMDTRTHAVNDYLDAYGQKRSCYRMEAQAAEATVQITFQATGISKTISAGTELTADGQQIYLTKEDIRQTGYTQVENTKIIAKIAGAAGNGLTEGTQMQLCITNTAVTNIIVTTSAAGGRNREDDENYRERIKEYGLASITTGPRQQYERVAREVSPAILDARAIRLAPCEVRVYLIVDEAADEESLKNEVLQALSEETQRPLTDLLSIEMAEQLAYVLNVKCTIESTLGATTLDNVLQEYQAWQDEKIWRPFNPDKLMAMLYQAGVSRVQWGDGSHFNGGTVEYTPIGESQCCKGTINLNVTT